MKKKLAFTLIEILVALMILSIAMTAVLFALNHQISSAQRLQNRTIALMVAENVLAEMQLGQLAVPAEGSSTQGNFNMLNKNWVWNAGIDAGSSEQIRRIKVSVTASGENRTAASLIGFLRKP